MKQILYDLGLVIIILCLGHIYFDDYNVQKVMFDRDIVSFEDRIENDEEVSSYGIYQDKEDNKISLYVRYTDLKTGKEENRLINKNK